MSGAAAIGMGLSPPAPQSPSASGSEPEEVVLMSPPPNAVDAQNDDEELNTVTRGADDEAGSVGSEVAIEENSDDTANEEVVSVVTVTRVVTTVATTTMPLSPNDTSDVFAVEELLPSSAEELDAVEGDTAEEDEVEAEPVQDEPVDTDENVEESAALSTVSNDGSANKDQGFSSTRFNAAMSCGSDGNTTEMSLSQGTLEAVVAEEADDEATDPGFPEAVRESDDMEVDDGQDPSVSYLDVSPVEDTTASDEEDIVLPGNINASTVSSTLPPSVNTTATTLEFASLDQGDVSSTSSGSGKVKATPRSGKRKAQGGEGSPQTMTPRRSKRIKRVTPKSSPAASPSLERVTPKSSSAASPSTKQGTPKASPAASPSLKRATPKSSLTASPSHKQVTSKPSRVASPSLKQVTSKPSPAASPSPSKRKAKKKIDVSPAELQFNITEEADEGAGSGTAQVWQCKHCGRKIKRQSAIERHLETCTAYQERISKEKELSTKMESVAEATSATSEAKALETLGSAVIDLASSTGNSANVKKDTGVELDQVSLVVWIFGSVENAEEMKAQYRRAPLVKQAPIDRFRALINDELFSLNVLKLLENGNDSNASLLVQGPSARFASEVKLDSATRALEVFSLGFSITMDAPLHAVSLMTSALSTDLGIGRHLGLSEGHPAKLVFSRSGTALGWSFHRSETFVFILRGTALWKMKPGGLHHPLQCLHSSSRSLIENAVAIKENALGLDRSTRRPELVPPFEHVFDDLEDDAEGLLDQIVDAGTVVYMPGGTWYQAASEHDAVWLEIHVGSMTYEELVMSGLRTLLRRDEKWGEPVLLGSTNDDGHAVCQKVGHLLEDLQQKIPLLKPNDLVPKFMMLGKSIDAESTSEGGETTLKVDLRADFSLGEVGKKRLRLGMSSAFHVNLLAVLVRSDEIPCDGSVASEMSGGLQPKTEHALQKKPKRACALRTLSRRTDHYEYVLMSVLGADRASKAKLCVKFRCSAAQADMVEWVRVQDGPFTLDELKRGVDREHQASGGPSDDAVKRVVRFLWCFGLLTADS